MVVWGGITYYRQHTPTTSEPNGTAGAAHQTFVQRSRQQLAASRVSSTEQYVIETAQAEWLAQPPVRPVLREAVAPVQPQHIHFTYTGFLQTGSELFAIINGREYRAGDPLKGVAGSVDTIAPGHVVLLLENGTKQVTIPFLRQP